MHVAALSWTKNLLLNRLLLVRGVSWEAGAPKKSIGAHALIRCSTIERETKRLRFSSEEPKSAYIGTSFLLLTSNLCDRVLSLSGCH